MNTTFVQNNKDSEMALPKKKGIRKINVDSIQYYYTIEHDYYASGLMTKIGKVEFPNERFQFLVKCSIEETFTMTPKVVKQAIQFANMNQLWSKITVHSHQFYENEFKLNNE